jgi:hypothetical protein
MTDNNMDHIEKYVQRISELRESLINKYEYDYHEEDDYDPEYEKRRIHSLSDDELITEFMIVYDLDDESEIEKNIGFY